MALSQIQCLDDNNINLRTNESKPEFFYSEDQRLALETLLDDGQERFEQYVKTNSIRPFLSELELAQLTRSVELYSPGSPDSSVDYNGDSEAEELSLQYWPERSYCSLPDLDIGWPIYTSFRGVTRVNVFAQPPLEGQKHIKEIVRKMIIQAQKVIAIVMDLFTDLDIFKDLLDASFKRKVAVYIMLETSGVPHFLKMCEKAAMHTGHLKNLRVRSIRGMEFFTHTSKKVCGSQSQKFMFVDGDKVVSGSYSFTWTASRLDRNIITVLSGQVVDAFDKLFQDLYVTSNAVNLHKIHLDAEPTPKLATQAAPVIFPSATIALKLTNPKYALVSSSATANSNRTPSENNAVKTESIKQMKEVLLIHPGLLNLEKVDLIHYLPLWPMPEPPSDVIGFINTRIYSKPPQAHFMHAELFEVSQPIRLKDPFHIPEGTPSDRGCARTTLEFLSPVIVPVNKQHHQITPVENTTHGKPLKQMQLTPGRHKESESEHPSHAPKTQNDIEHKTESPEPHDMEKHVVSSAEQGEEIRALSQSFGGTNAASLSEQQCTGSQISVNPPSCSEKHCSAECTQSPVPKTTRTLFSHSEATLLSQSCNNATEPFTSTNETHSTNLYYAKTPKHDSSCSSTSEEYFECSDSLAVDSGFEGVVKGMQFSSRLSDKNWGLNEPNNSATRCTTAVTLPLQQWPGTTITADSREQESRHESLKEPGKAQSESGSEESWERREMTGMMIHKHSELEGGRAVLANKTVTQSELVYEADKLQIPESDAKAWLGLESKLLGSLLKAKTDTRVESEDKVECRDVQVEKLPLHKLTPDPYSVVNNMICFKSKELTDSDKSFTPENTIYHIVLQDKEFMHVTAVKKSTKVQSILFSDTVNGVQEVKPRLQSCFSSTSDQKSTVEMDDIKHPRVLEEATALHMLFQGNPSAKSLHEENSKPPSGTRHADTEELLTVENSGLGQAGDVRDVYSSGPELKEKTVEQNRKFEPPVRKSLVGTKSSANICSIRKQKSSPKVVRKEEPILEHTCNKNKNQPEAKPKSKQNMKKLHPASPKPTKTPKDARGGSLKAPGTTLRSSNHPTRPAAPTPGAPRFPHRKQPEPNRADELSPSRTAAPRASQAHLGHARVRLGPHRSPQTQRQVQLDTTRLIQLGQPGSQPRHSSAAGDNASSSGASLPKRLRRLKDEIKGSSQSNQKVIRSIRGKEQE